MTIKHVTVQGHTKTINGKVIWVPEYHKDIEVGLESEFSEHFPAPEKKPEPTPEPEAAAEPTTNWKPGPSGLHAIWIAHNQEPGHDKVYKLGLHKDPHGDWWVISRYGKQGASLGQSEFGPYTEKEAAKQFDLIKNAKHKKGYKQADSTVWSEVEKQEWKAVGIKQIKVAEPKPAPEPAKPEPKPDYQTMPEDLGIHFGETFGEAPKTKDHQTSYSPEPKIGDSVAWDKLEPGMLLERVPQDGADAIACEVVLANEDTVTVKFIHKSGAGTNAYNWKKEEYEKPVSSTAALTLKGHFTLAAMPNSTWPVTIQGKKLSNSNTGWGPSQDTTEPKPARVGPAGEQPLQDKTKLGNGKFVQYGPNGAGVSVFHKTNGMTQELRVMINDTGDAASILKNDLEDMGAKWMPKAKVYALTLPGLPWASGKAKAAKLHAAIMHHYGPGTASTSTPVPVYPEGTSLAFKAVSPGMKFTLKSGQSKATWTIHEAGPKGVSVTKEYPGAEPSPKMWVSQETWNSDYQGHLHLSEPFTGKVLQVGDTKVEDGKTYKLNANHKWELVEDLAVVSGPDILTAVKGLTQTGAKAVLANGFTIGAGTAMGKKTIRVYAEGMSDAMKQALLDQGFKENSTNSYFWKNMPASGGAVMLNTVAGLMKANPHGKAQAAGFAIPPKPAAATAKPAQAQVAPPPPTMPAINAPDSFPFTKIGDAKGSNPGGVYKDNYGKQWYIKFPKTEDHAKNEILAAQLYKMVGIAGPKLKIVKQNGKVGIASAWQDGLTVDAKGIGSAPGTMEGFGMDAWLANWDVAGLGFDNILKDKDGKAVRIDVGGSLLYRAMGEDKKGFGNTVPEVDSLLNPSMNDKASALFKGITKAQMNASIATVLVIPDHIIEDAVKKFGPGDDAAKKALADKLIARKNYLAGRFPDANAIAHPPKPDPAKLPVQVNDFPKAPNFNDWQGQGKGLSGNASINAQNQEAADKIYAIATAGNLTALKALTYSPIGGAGTESMASHKSQHIQKMFTQCVATLEGIADPNGSHAKTWDLSFFAGDLDEISDAFPSHHYGVTKTNIDQSKRIGYWLHIGEAEGAEALVPQTIHNVTDKESENAKKQNKNGLPAIVRSFMQAVKSSGSANNPYRDGKEIDHSGNKCREVIALAYEHAVEFEEGATIRRQQGVELDMVEKLVSMKPGGIFSNPGSMCCSKAPNWNWGGTIDLEIVYAKGAKALYNIGVGSYDSEQEITTLPGQRFMMIESKAKGPKGTPFFKLLMLPPDPAYVAGLKQKSAA